MELGTALPLDNSAQLRLVDSCKGQAGLDESLQKRSLVEGMSKRVYDYVSQSVPLYSEKVLLVDTYRIKDYYDINTPLLGIVDVCPVNYHSNINKYLFEINSHIPETATFVGCFVTQGRKNARSFAINKAKPLCDAEALGRLVYAGFSIIEFRVIEGLLYFMVMKVKNCPKVMEGCSNGLIFPMKRIGKDKKVLKVFKFRTMHPYSEYLQDYVVRMNGYNELGKPAKDFRLTTWGRVFRKYWLDELPQIFNFFRGELAIVGVRPLSRARFKELPSEVQEMRIKLNQAVFLPMWH